MNTPIKKLASKVRSNNPHESNSTPGIGFFEDLKDQAGLKPFSKDFFEQLLAVNNGAAEKNKKPSVKMPMSGDLSQGQAIDLKRKPAQQHEEPSHMSSDAKGAEKKPNNIRPGIDWFSELNRSSEFVSRRESQEIQAQIKQIVEELRKLVNTSTVLKSEFDEVIVQAPPATPGKYHLNFFTWMLSVIRAARMRVEDSGAWLNVMKSKKKNTQYWNMAKKHGTTFSLSNERVVSTQTG